MNGRAVNSCQVLAPEANESLIETVEGLSIDGTLHPLQESFIDHNAIQCGFCTPGMLMSSKALLDRNPQPTEDEIRLALVSNLYRCTGYIRIVDTIKQAAQHIAKNGLEN